MRNITQTDLKSAAAEFAELILELGRRRPFRDPLASGDELHTPAQFHTLVWLGHDGPLTMGELARRLCITEKSITGLVDRMEREGLLKRERDEADRRVVRSRLTKKGESSFRQMNEHFCQKLSDFLGAMDFADRKDLFRIFRKVLERAGIASAAPAGKQERGSK